MFEKHVLIVGAGVSGLSAASVVAELGSRVTLVDQAQALGGNIYRQPVSGPYDFPMHAEHRANWQRVIARFENNKKRISIHLNKRYAGVDHSGVAFIEDPVGDNSTLITPDAIIIATGASERVQPRVGWTSPNVLTSGAMQTAMKLSGKAPLGRVVLAGSGPLLLAVGAQMAKLGNPPVAIVEAGRPFGPSLHALGLPKEYIFEALRYMFALKRAGVRIYTEAEIERIEQPNSLKVFIRDRKGRRISFGADFIGLHDGLKSNAGFADKHANVPVLRTGDCREILGARAAELDGLRVGKDVIGILGGSNSENDTYQARIQKHRKAQKRISKLYAHESHEALRNLPGDTVICRCENRTVSDLEALENPTAKEARLVGRFGMGNCQGRFCAEWVQHMQNSTKPETPPQERWPIRPVSIASLIGAKPETSLISEPKGQTS